MANYALGHCAKWRTQQFSFSHIIWQMSRLAVKLLISSGTALMRNSDY